MKKCFLFVFLGLLVAILTTGLYADEGGAYVQLRNGNAVGIASVGVNNGVSTTFTAKGIKFMPFSATAVNGVVTITFPNNTFTNAGTYFVLASLRGVTFNANALAVTRFSATTAIIYTTGLTDVVDGMAIGY